MHSSFAMPFEKNHKYRWESDQPTPLDKTPICFKGRMGQKEKLKLIPGWPDKLRDYIDSLPEDGNIKPSF